MSQPSIKILLIERDADLSRAIRNLLAQAERVNFDVASAETVEAAIPHLASGPFQAVLIDVSPRNGGVGALTRIRERTPDSALVALCDIADEDAAIESLQQGAQDYLMRTDLKPSVLEHAIRYAVGRKRADDDLRHS